MISTILKCCIIFHAVSNVVFAADGCFHPGQRLHAKAIMSKEDENGVYPVNTIVSYSCDPGYQLLDNDSRRCLDNESWSGSETYCGVNVGSSARVSTSPNLETIVLRDSYEECIHVNTSETTFNIEFNKDYIKIELLKLTFQIDESQEEIVPTVSYDISTLDPKVWKNNAVLLKRYPEPSRSKANVVFQYAFVDKSSPTRNFSMKIGGPKDNFDLCDIALYSTSAIPESWCKFDYEDDSDTLKHLLYKDKCYVVIGSKINYSTGTESNRLCRDYRTIYNSTLVAYNDGSFQYIRDSLINTPLDLGTYWISDMNNQNRCGRINFRKNKTWKRSHDDCDSEYGRICQYDIPQCGTPDQKNGTVMRFKDGSTTAIYSCPNNFEFELEGRAERTCSKGQWSPDALTCKLMPTTTSEVVSSAETRTTVTSLSCTTETNLKDSCDSQYDAIYTRIIKITCIVVAVFVILICLTTGLALIYIKYYLKEYSIRSLSTNVTK